MRAPGVRLLRGGDERLMNVLLTDASVAIIFVVLAYRHRAFNGIVVALLCMGHGVLVQQLWLVCGPSSRHCGIFVFTIRNYSR